jgi:hypothetical protein
MSLNLSKWSLKSIYRVCVSEHTKDEIEASKHNCCICDVNDLIFCRGQYTWIEYVFYKLS